MSRKPVGGGFLKKIEIVKTGGRTEIVAAANRLMASRAKHLIMQVQTKDMVGADGDAEDGHRRHGQEFDRHEVVNR